MKNILLIIKYTIREALSKKIMVTFMIVSSVLLLLFGIVMGFVNIEAMAESNKISIENTDDFLALIVKPIELFIIGSVYWLGLFLSFFSCAGFIPNLLKKGNIDLFLSKPISKVQLLAGKYLGALAIIIANISFLIFASWIIIGLKFSYWDTGYLSAIIAICYTFAVIYALMVLLSMLTKSPVLPLIISFLIVIIISPILAVRENFYQLTDNSIFKGIMESLYYSVPQSTDIGKYAESLILGTGNADISVFFTSGLLMVIYLVLAGYVFIKKDF